MPLSVDLDLLSALIFNLNKAKKYENAYYFNNKLHRINTAVDPIHPNALNSCITSLRLVKKLKGNPLIFNHKAELVKELLLILEGNCEKYHEYDLSLRDAEGAKLDDFGIF